MKSEGNLQSGTRVRVTYRNENEPHFGLVASAPFKSETRLLTVLMEDGRLITVNRRHLIEAPRRSLKSE